MNISNRNVNMKTTNQAEITSGADTRRELFTKRITLSMVAVVMLAGVAVLVTFASEHDKDAAPIFVKEIPPGYRDWKVVTVAHEAGDLNDIRAVLGNDIAIKAYREGKLPFPEGAIVGRIAGATPLRRKTTKPLAVTNLSRPANPRMPTCNSWSRTQRSMRRLAAGDTHLSARTANPPTRRLCKAVIPATRRSNLAILFSPVTHRDADKHKETDHGKRNVS